MHPTSKSTYNVFSAIKFSMVDLKLFKLLLEICTERVSLKQH